MASIKSYLISLKLVTSLLSMPTYLRPLFRRPLIPTDSLYCAGRVRGCRQESWFRRKALDRTDTAKPFKLKCLMFADIAVLLSETASGLQNCINRMSNYCSIWQLSVNTPKTKVIIFNIDDHRTSRCIFSLHDETIAITQSYTSLGIVFVSGGSFRQACNVLTDKTKTKLLSYTGLTPQ